MQQICIIKMHTIILALGSNVGNKKTNIAKAVSIHSEKKSRVSMARLYDSKAMGFEHQDDFINTALIAQTQLSPEDLLLFTQATEKRVGRIFRLHWGPREIDIDIILYDDLIYKTANLEIPHPKMAERDFVLMPLMDIAPDFVHPIFKQTVKQLYGALDKSHHSIIKQSTP